MCVEYAGMCMKLLCMLCTETGDGCVGAVVRSGVCDHLISSVFMYESLISMTVRFAIRRKRPDHIIHAQKRLIYSHIWKPIVATPPPPYSPQVIIIVITIIISSCTFNCSVLMRLFGCCWCGCCCCRNKIAYMYKYILFNFGRIELFCLSEIHAHAKQTETTTTTTPHTFQASVFPKIAQDVCEVHMY